MCIRWKMQLLLLVSPALLALSARVKFTAALDEEPVFSGHKEPTESFQRCCCDEDNYAPGQCRSFAPEELQRSTNPFKLIGGLFPSGGDTRVCPSVEIFNDGLGVRQTHQAKGGAGCDTPRITPEAYGLEATPAEGLPKNLDIPEQMSFVMLSQDPDIRGSAKSLAANAVLMRSLWTVTLHTSFDDTVTARPTYQLEFHLRADSWNQEGQAPTLPLAHVDRLHRVDVDGRPAVELQLDDGRQLLLVPTMAVDVLESPAVDFSPSNQQNIVMSDWSLVNLPGVSGGNRCCCQGDDKENCRLKKKCDFSGYEIGEDFLRVQFSSNFSVDHYRPRDCALAAESEEEVAALAAAEELGIELAKARKIESGDKTGDMEAGTGARLLYEPLAETDFQCHSEGALRGLVAAGWQGGVGAEVRSFKAVKGGTGFGGVTGFALDVFGRHQHLVIGNRKSCIGLVREGASEEDLEGAGCSAFKTKAAIVAVVQECLDITTAVESANLRAWRTMTSAMIKNSWLEEPLQKEGYEPTASWQKLLAEDPQRIEMIRLAAITLKMQPNKNGVWDILQRASVYAQKQFHNPDAYLEKVNRKLDEVDSMFWTIMKKPADMRSYPHMYNTVGSHELRELVNTPQYQALVQDEDTIASKIVPNLKEDTPQAFSAAVAECKQSGKCAEPPLLFELMLKGQGIEDPSFWKKVPAGWLAGLAGAPEIHPTPPKSDKLVFPRSAREIFGKCFVAPQAAVNEAYEVETKLRSMVKAKSYLREKEGDIFEPMDRLGDRNTVLHQLDAVLEESAGTYVEDLATSSVQGSLACYPTLFGLLGMELELRDETGYAAGGKRAAKDEQVLGMCSVAPHCARLAVERLLHFNAKHWDRYASIKLNSTARLCAPGSKSNGNCQLFTRCFKAEVEKVCDEIPGCCEAAKPGETACRASEDYSLLADMKTTLGW